MLNEEQKTALKWVIRKPHVNSACIGCGACMAISSEVFEFNDDWLSIVKKCESYEWHDVDDSISACPTQAISWQEADQDGNYLNGIIEHHDVK